MELVKNDIKLLAISVYEHNMNKLCGYCAAPATKRCVNCKQVFYCGRQCQKNDYKSHKTFCIKDMVPNALYPDDVVVVGHELGAMIYSPKRNLNMHLLPISHGVFRVTECGDNQVTFHDNFANEYHAKPDENVTRIFRCRNCNSFFDTLSVL